MSIIIARGWDALIGLARSHDLLGGGWSQRPQNLEDLSVEIKSPEEEGKGIGC